MCLAGKVLESMPYADAVIKEALRVHPIVSSLFRRTLQVRISPAGFARVLALGRGCSS